MDESPPPPMQPTVVVDPWRQLRGLTPARIGLGRAGHALPTRELLAADAAHARARAAVHVPLDVAGLVAELAALPGVSSVIEVASAAPDRGAYLLRPDLGRRLAPRSRDHLAAHPAASSGCAVAIVIGDGLSTTAVQRHAVPLVAAILAERPAMWRIGPIVVARQARVALGDEIGAALRAEFVAVLVGERPGLSCQESVGLYLTRDPRPGRTDAERNCLSNIHPGGLQPPEAARRLWWLAREGRRIDATGVSLKDRSGRSSSAAMPGARSGRPRFPPP